MDRSKAKWPKNAPLRERTRKLRSDVQSLNQAISAELDWREKLHPVQIDEWDGEEVV